MSTDPSSHVYYAHRIVLAGGDAAYLHATPKRERLRYYGGTEPVVAVRLRERTDADPPSPYYGWLATGASEYTMVWRYSTSRRSRASELCDARRGGFFSLRRFVSTITSER